MKRAAATLLLCALFASALAGGGKGRPSPPAFPDSLSSFDLYVAGIGHNAIRSDTARARACFAEAVRRDSTYAPAYYELAAGSAAQAPDEAVALARKAYRLDTANLWYHRLYGQTLIAARRYGEALRVYRDLTAADAHDPDNFRLLAALYEEEGQPYAAIATLDTAELRFGRIPQLTAAKRRLLLATRQFGKALREAERIAADAPYDARNHTALAEIHASMGKDSLARAAYDRAFAADSTDMTTLLSLADFHDTRRDYRAQLAVVRRLFALDEMPLDSKIGLFERLTADMQFYRDHYYQLHDLASTLIVRYPAEKRVVELYARHLIASGELEQALALYKIRTNDTPPEADYFKHVIDIESYLQRPDSVQRYVDRALELFPSRSEFRISKGHVETYAKRYDAAIEAYASSLDYAENDSLRSAIWGLIGDIWHQKALETAAQNTPGSRGEKARGRAVRTYMKECYRAYDRSLRYDAENASVLNNYAYFLALEPRDLDRALAMAERATKRSENNPTFLDTRAWVLHRMGRTEEARTIMRQAIALDRQQSPELLVHYGDILQALGERFMAETYWRKALEKGYDAQAIVRRLSEAQKPRPEAEK